MLTPISEDFLSTYQSIESVNLCVDCVDKQNVVPRVVLDILGHWGENMALDVAR